MKMGYRDLEFPKSFLWGSAAAAHQTEGGNFNNWTEWEKIPGKRIDGSESSIACEHYNRDEEDFDLAKELGHQVHRFSIEWSRIEPEQDKWNEDEIDHYRSILQALIDRDIQPMVTLHHFTEPVWFRDIGSWLNPKSPEMFAPYCRKIAESFSDFDIIWNTINEPMVVTTMGYVFGEFPPEERDFGKGLTVAKHLLMGHGQAATQLRQVYDEIGKAQPQIAPVISVSHFMPADPENGDDLELVEYLDEIYNHIWIRGAIEGILPEPAGDGGRYPPLDDSVDFIGLNYYSRMVVSSELDFMAGEMPPKDSELERCEGLDWEVYPEGYYQVLRSFGDKYDKPIFLTENGIGTSDDAVRQRYIINHLQEVHRAIQEGVEILGYLVWSLTDNFEWAQGFSSHFGLVEIDYDSLERKPKESAYMFREIIEENALTKEIQEKYLRD
jgi:beta-glucosidase